MRTIFLFLIFLLLIAIRISGQKHTISGFVSDSSNNERLINASVLIRSSNKVILTNEQGYFSISISKKRDSLRISYVGFNSFEKDITLTKDTFLYISLTPNNRIKEITILKESSPSFITHKISANQLSKLPVLGGETDLMKSLQLIPGIQSGNEGLTGLLIKGGDDSQNLILIDGVPVYNPNHLFGFFSIFNERSIQDITVYQGNFPAKYGGRLSSVVDIQTKEGTGNKINGSITTGALASTVNLEGPLKNNKTTFFLSGRLSYLQFLATPIIKHFTKYNAAGYQFYDYNGKITHRFNNKNKLIFSYYGSYDFGFTNEQKNESGLQLSNNFQWQERTSWRNNIYSLSWNYVVNPKLFLTTVANLSNYYYNYQSQNSYSGQQSYDMNMNEFYSSVRDHGLNTHLTWFFNPSLTIRAGVGFSNHVFIPGVDVTRATNLKVYDAIGNPISMNIDTTIGNISYHPQEYTSYIENEIQLGEHFKIKPGIRLISYHNQTIFNRIEPRLNLQWTAGKGTILASYTQTNQYIHLLQSAKINQSTDLWIPSSGSIKPEKSDQISLSIKYPFANLFNFSLEPYYKKLTNLIEYKEGFSYSSTATSWENKVTSGSGKSLGIIFTIEKQYGNTTGWISYTLSKSTRKFDELNSGNEFPFAFSRPHDLKLVVSHKFTEKLEINSTWVYHSGNNLTFGDVKYFGNFIFLQKNGYRLPDYHRLDLNAIFHFNYRKLDQSLSLSVYNVYNRKNIYSLDYYRDPNGDIFKVRERSLFPIIPSFTYQINF